MRTLNRQEIECLKKLEQMGGQTISPPADIMILDNLISLGLVERVPATGLPLESPAHFYRLTVVGWKYCS